MVPLGQQVSEDGPVRQALVIQVLQDQLVWSVPLARSVCQEQGVLLEDLVRWELQERRALMENPIE